MINEELLKLKTNDYEHIALWKISGSKSELNKSIFLTHGAFSDRKICSKISRYFVNLGYTCWIMEWRNHGKSSKVKKKFNFETIAKYDIKTAFEYFFETLNIKNIACITHSGGGICLTMFLIRNQKYVSKVSSITMFSCQSFGACHSIKNYLKMLVSKFLSRILGYIPGKKIGLGPHDESYAMIKQWYDWNLLKNFKGENNYNYLKNMSLVKTPILSICSGGDTFIAPQKGCQDFLSAFGNPQNKLLFCSTTNGHSENYNHTRIILSRNSAKEIWPVVSQWIGRSQN